MTEPFVDTVDTLVAEMTGARFSADRTYRYVLWRTWDAEKPRMMVIGLNPSTADEVKDDPTIRRCIGFAKRDGYGGLSMLNMYAYRSTDPLQLPRQPDPTGPENDRYISAFAATSRIVVCAWGAFGAAGFAVDRAKTVVTLLRSFGITPQCFGVTLLGHPRHPLYLKSDTAIVPLPTAR